MIYGIGSDIVEIQRIKDIFEDSGDKFIQKYFTKNEIAAAEKINNQHKKVAFYAKRFSAKEAFAKALGTGFRDGVTFKGIEISNDELGKPNITISNKIKQILHKNLKHDQATKIHLTISDEKNHALSFVIIEILM